MRRHPSSLHHKDLNNSWCQQECLAFQFLIDAMKFSDNHPSSLEITAERILTEYQNLQQLSGNTKLMKEKTLDDVRMHLKAFSRNLETFQTLYSRQSEENWAHMGIYPVDVDMADGNQLVVIVESSE
jgi:ASC-1-like (ASCH) protein